MTQNLCWHTFWQLIFKIDWTTMYNESSLSFALTISKPKAKLSRTEDKLIYYVIIEKVILLGHSYVLSLFFYP